MPWFPQREPEKGGRQEHQPRGESSTPSAADESFEFGQELRWAEERLCTMEDSQSVTGFGGPGQVGNVAFAGKIRADCETQKLQRKDFFQWIVEKVDRGGFQTVLSERHSESEKFVRIERHVPRVGPVCDFIQTCSERRSCCLPV